MAGRGLVVGVDAGGTGTRCVVATLAGEVVGRGVGGGGANFRSSADPVGNLRAALVAALAGVDATAVAGGVFGMAGAGPAGYAKAAMVAVEAWAAAGLAGAPGVVTDLETGFAGATAERAGALLIAGTGAVAVRFAGGRAVRRVDGHGWLAGDEGGGVWLGLHGVRAVLGALDGRGDWTALVGAVVREVLGAAGGHADAVTGRVGGADDPALLAQHADIAQALVAELYPPEPARIAGLAPVVDAAARAGDAVAVGIVEEAAGLLLLSLRAVVGERDEAGAGRGEPVVLAGSLLTKPTVVSERVRAGLAVVAAGRPVVEAGDAAAGAAALAIRGVVGAGEGEAAHRRLLAGG